MTGTKVKLPMRSALEGGHNIPTLAVLLIWAANVLTVWSHRSQSRAKLTELNRHRLKDIGISREEAEVESLKRFWMP